MTSCASGSWKTIATCSLSSATVRSRGVGARDPHRALEAGGDRVRHEAVERERERRLAAAASGRARARPRRGDVERDAVGCRPRRILVADAHGIELEERGGVMGGSRIVAGAGVGGGGCADDAGLGQPNLQPPRWDDGRRSSRARRCPDKRFRPRSGLARSRFRAGAERGACEEAECPFGLGNAPVSPDVVPMSGRGATTSEGGERGNQLRRVRRRSRSPASLPQARERPWPGGHDRESRSDRVRRPDRLRRPRCRGAARGPDQPRRVDRPRRHRRRAGRGGRERAHRPPSGGRPQRRHRPVRVGRRGRPRAERRPGPPRDDDRWPR